MEVIKKCIYCGNETAGDVCLNCQEYDGIVEGVYYKDEFVEVERQICDRCQELDDCIKIDNKWVCVECIQEEE